MHRLLAVSVIVLSSASGSLAQRATLSGSVAYRERLALPPSAVVEVAIEDVSRADVAGEVVARVRLSSPTQVPIPFDLPYDPGRIDPAHRYAVRASILDGDTIVFRTTDTTLVLTQGHPSHVALMLHAVPGQRRAAAAPAAMSRPAAPARPPAVDLRNLPATFTGTLPCADCPAVRYQLNLFPDDSFAVRMSYMDRPAAGTRDAVGSWVLSSDRRVVILKRADETAPEYFAIRDAGTLQKLDGQGQPIASKQPDELHRSGGIAPIDVNATLRGAYRASGDAATFTDCASGVTWPVAMSGDAPALASAYRAAGRKAGEPLVLSVQAHLHSNSREPAAGQTLVADRLVGAQATDSCAARFSAAPFETTTWRLVWLGGTAVAAAASTRAEPSLSFRADSPTFSGSGGCNRLAGQYQQRGDALAMTAVGTLIACPGADDLEQRFKTAIAQTRSYRVLGQSLELFDEHRTLLARLDAKPGV